MLAADLNGSFYPPLVDAGGQSRYLATVGRENETKCVGQV